MNDFSLNKQLIKDCYEVCDLSLSKVLLMDDANFPWCILVPRRDAVSEIFQLNEADQLQCQRESTKLAKIMMDIFNADKMNVTALGNVVNQLHIHHIARFKTDAAWPSPVWGKLTATPYEKAEANKIINDLREQLIV